MGEQSLLVARLEYKLQKTFAPDFVEVINESHLHAGHQPGFNGEGETHMRIRIRAAHFKDMSRVEIHRAINALCSEELAQGLHALAIDAKGI